MEKVRQGVGPADVDALMQAIARREVKAVPDSALGMRVFCLARRINFSRIAEIYGCSRPWVSMVFLGQSRASEQVMRRLRAAVAKAAKEQRKIH